MTTRGFTVLHRLPRAVRLAALLLLAGAGAASAQQPAERPRQDPPGRAEPSRPPASRPPERPRAEPRREEPRDRPAPPRSTGEPSLKRRKP